MRILHVTDTYAPTLGGIEVFVADLASRQAADGHEVTVLTRTAGPVGPSGPSESGPRICRDADRLAELTDRADVVHAHASLISPLAFRAVEGAGGHGIPALMTVHSMWNDARLPLRALAALRGWADLPVAWAAVSTAAAAVVGSVLGRSDIMVLPNAVDAAAWSPGPLPDREPESVVRIVAVGRLARRKRPMPLLRILGEARRLTPAHRALEAVVVGDGPLAAAVRRQVRESSLASWVRAPGTLTRAEIAELYRTSSIFVAPAVRESFGIAALEARNAGLVVLARSGTGVADFIAPGTAGYLEGSDDRLAGRLAQLCDDGGLRRRMMAHNVRTGPALDWSDVLWRNEFAYELAADLAPLRPARRAAAAQDAFSHPQLASGS